MIHLKKNGKILKMLRMNANGRISEMANHCFHFIFGSQKVKEKRRKMKEKRRSLVVEVRDQNND